MNIIAVLASSSLVSNIVQLLHLVPLYTAIIDEHGAIWHSCRGMTRRKNICCDEVVMASRRSSVNWFVRYELTLAAEIHRPGCSEEIFWLLSLLHYISETTNITRYDRVGPSGHSVSYRGLVDRLYLAI